MCIAINLLSSCRDRGGDLKQLIDIPIVVETLRYQSAARKVLIAFDMIVRNRAQKPVHLYLTHADNVEARLATEDWFPKKEAKSDDRMRLMRQIYGPYWKLERRLLTYTDPIRGSLGAKGDNEPVEARPFIYCPRGVSVGSDVGIDPSLIDATDEVFGTWRLKRQPQDDGPLNEAFRPFSTFQLGPIPPGVTIFARTTLVIRGETYTRLVQPEPGCPFPVVSAPKVVRQIEVSGLPDFVKDPHYPRYERFFREDIQQDWIEPHRYHIIIAQPSKQDDRDEINPDDQLVKFRPASSSISELYIANHAARERALWFNTWSSDFRLILQYEGRREQPSRADFARPLSQNVGA